MSRVHACRVCGVCSATPDCDPRTIALWAPLSVGSPGKNAGVGCRFLLPGLFPTQGLNSRLLHLPHWQADPSPMGHLGSPYMRKYTHTILKTSGKWRVVTNICAQNRYCTRHILFVLSLFREAHQHVVYFLSQDFLFNVQPVSSWS